MDISVVIPVYGCRKALPELHRRLTETLSSIVKEYEIILVDDCCPQNSWEDIKAIAKEDSHVVGIHFLRNFGQIRAITAGLDQSKGDWVVVMDCDLQDQPEAIAELYAKAQEGYDVVYGRRVGRVDTAMTKFLSRMFYKVYDYFTEGTYDASINNFSISARKVIDGYCQMREQNRSFTMFLKWLGFRQIAIDVKAAPRYEGKSSYNMRRKLKLAFEVITTQSNKPLMFAVELGFLISFFALLYILYLIIHAATQNPVEGWTTIVASIYLMGGFILSAVGIVGIYVGNVFNGIKNRPLYVVTETMNAGEHPVVGGEDVR